MIPASVWVYTPPISPTFGRPVVVVTTGGTYAIGRVVRDSDGVVMGILWDATRRGGTTQQALVKHAEQMDNLRFKMSVPTTVGLTEDEAAEIDTPARVKHVLSGRIMPLVTA